MPTLNKRQSTRPSESDWFIRKNTSNLHSAPPVSTFQIDPAGVQLVKSLDSRASGSAQAGDQLEFDDDVFYILHDLGFLSTRGDGPSPGDVLANDGVTDHIESLSEAQRTSFALTLIESLTPHDRCAYESVFTFLCTLSDLSEENRQSVLHALLEPTPYDATVIDGFADTLDAAFETDYGFLSQVSPVGIATVLSYLYDGLLSTDTGIDRLADSGAGPVWTTDEWVCFAGTPNQIEQALSPISDVPRQTHTFIEQLLDSKPTGGQSLQQRFFTEIGSDLAVAQLTDPTTNPFWTCALLRLGAKELPDLTFVLLPRGESFETYVDSTALDGITEVF